MSLKNVYGIVKPFGLDGGIETLKMAPTCLLVLHMVNVVAKVEADYVAVSKHVFEGHDYEYWSPFGEIINVKFRGCGGVLIPYDANSNFSHVRKLIHI